MRSTCWATPIPPADYIRTTNDPTWSKYIVSAPQIAWYYAFMNVLEKPFDNLKVRQAVNYAIDTSKIQKLLSGQGEVAQPDLPQRHAGLPGRQDVLHLRPGEGEAAAQRGRVPERVQVHVRDATTSTRSPSWRRPSRPTSRRWASPRTSSRWTAPPTGTTSASRSRTPQIGLSDWYLDFPDPSDWIGPMFTNPIDGGANSSFYENPQVEPRCTRTRPASSTRPSASRCSSRCRTSS